MNKKMATLISTITGAVATIAIALVTFFAPPMAAAVNASISVASTAVVTIVNNFVVEE